MSSKRKERMQQSPLKGNEMRGEKEAEVKSKSNIPFLLPSVDLSSLSILRVQSPNWVENFFKYH